MRGTAALVALLAQMALVSQSSASQPCPCSPCDEPCRRAVVVEVRNDGPCCLGVEVPPPPFARAERPDASPTLLVRGNELPACPALSLPAAAGIRPFAALGPPPYARLRMLLL